MNAEEMTMVFGLVFNAGLLIWLITMIINKPTSQQVQDMIDNKIDTDIKIIKTFMIDIYGILKKDAPSYLKK